MANFVDHWGHGVNTWVDNAESMDSIVHGSLGTSVEFKNNTDNARRNWMHLSIPTPTTHNSSAIYLHYVHLRGWVNENARVAEISICQDGHQIHLVSNLSWVDQPIDDVIKLPDTTKIGGAICVSLSVEFLTGTPAGHIDIYGVGGRFEAK